MHPVVRGCVQDITENSKVPEELRVDEELIDEVELGVDQHLGGGNGQRQGEVEPVSHPAQALQHWLSGNSQVEPLDTPCTLSACSLLTSGRWSS